MNAVKTIFQKELKRIFTDRRLVFSLILPGLLIYVMYSIMGEVMMNPSPSAQEYTVYYQQANAPESLNAIFTSTEDITFHVNEEDRSVEEILTGIQEGSIDLYLEYSENFLEEVAAYSPESGRDAPYVFVYYNAGKENSLKLYTMYTSAMDAFESSVANKFDLLSEDQASSDDMSISLFSSMLPMLLMTFLFTGAMSVATESVAGEKERGTIATLLITPVKRSQIAIGKIAALGLTSLISATASFCGLVFSLPKLTGMESLSLGVYDASTYVLLFLVVAVTVLLFTTLLTIVSTVAKNAKEASGMAAPIMIVVMLIGILGMMDLNLKGIGYYCIPVYSSVLCFKSILSQNFEMLYLGLTVITSLITIGAGTYILTKLFNSEKVMFN